MTRWQWAYPSAVGVAILVYILIPYGGATGALYLLTTLSCVVAILLGIRINAPAKKAPWLLLAAGQFSLFLGEAIYAYREDILGIDPTPSAADVGYVLAYPLLVAGLALMVRRARRADDVVGLIDSAVVTVGLGALIWVVVGSPILRSDPTPGFERMLAVAYPVFDIILLAMLVRLMFSPAARTLSFRLFAAGVIPLVVADTIFASEMILIDHPVVPDVLWMASYAMWGAAALHPTMRSLSDGTEAEPRAIGGERFLVLGAAALILPGILAVELVLDLPLDPWTMVIGGFAIIILAVARFMVDTLQIRKTVAQRNQLESDLIRATSEDSLTQVSNRPYAIELVQSALDRNHAKGLPTGLLHIDLDQFMQVNDTVGQYGGDQVLQEVARRLRDVVGSAGWVGRLSGDQFIVLVEAPDSQTAIVELGNRLLEALRAPQHINGIEIRISASIGVTITADPSNNVGHFLHEADVAATRAKMLGRGRVEVFDDELRNELDERVRLEIALLAAVENDELTVHYQPVVALQTGIIDGYEALVRWDRPGAGQISPADFIPIAEMSDLICRIDIWVLHEATRQLARWTVEDPEAYEDLSVAVNISGRHLAKPSVVDDVREALEVSGLSPNRLSLEVTETVLVDVPTASIRLQKLRDMGVSISIDDFGTGYTSISQLQTLPADALKIDRSFIASEAPGSVELITLMVTAAHACGLLVIAEGVERQEDLDRIDGITVDGAQGYFFAKAVPSSRVAMVTDPENRRHLRAVQDQPD